MRIINVKLPVWSVLLLGWTLANAGNVGVKFVEAETRGFTYVWTLTDVLLEARQTKGGVCETGPAYWGSFDLMRNGDLRPTDRKSFCWVRRGTTLVMQSAEQDGRAPEIVTRPIRWFETLDRNGDYRPLAVEDLPAAVR